MLQKEKASSNAYSWWWASHIRTKQSKWLEQNLEDMEGKVEHVLNLIQKDGDSFAKRAEMYYRHRPELISFVEETVRAYRALAERYDKLSTELQKANTTIASVCPDQVTYDLDYDDDYGPKNAGQNAPKVHKTPKLPNKDVKGGTLNEASKKTQTVPETKEEAMEEIEKLQKEILSVETMKEFMKSSYENTLASYQDAENKIAEMQQKISSLQDEFEVSKVIEENDALTSMAEAALKSCEVNKADNESAKTVVSTTDGVLESDKKLTDEEIENQGTLLELKSGIAKRDNEIRSLKQELKLLRDIVGTDKVPSENGSQTVSSVEEILRKDIDAILDENLDFWRRFSTTFHQVRKFKTSVQDLQEEMRKAKNKGIEGKSSTDMFTTDLTTDVRPIYNHLKEIKNELTVWLEQSASLKEEVQRRCSSLSNIQENIRMALRKGMEEEEIEFGTHQAAKFEGEILNMQQENKKVNEELQAGINHVAALQLEIEKTLGRLEKENGLGNNRHQPHLGTSANRASIPLKSHILKEKKRRKSFFDYIQHHKKFSAYKVGLI